jgi:hypothetical protein
VKRVQPAGLDRAAALLADSIQASAQALQRLVDCRDLVLGGIVDRLQSLVILQLDGAIAPVADEWLATPLEIGCHALVTLEQGAPAGLQALLHLADIMLWNGHALHLPWRLDAGKMARRW